ncbi:metallophosphatase family protein [Candidatus Woesearchaeota archaeon]|nr:metallophosphatase family protein [Candidatus Woesearchaeota archaeon]
MAKKGIISDIHANLGYLNRVLKELQNRGIEDIACLGDILEDTPSANDCVDLLIAKGVRSVRGNHDDVFLKHSEHLTPETVSYIQALPPAIVIGDSIFVHDHPLGEDYRNKQFFSGNYIRHHYQAKELLERTVQKYIFLGHTHNPAVFSEDEMVEFPEGRVLQLSQEKRYVLNPGAVPDFAIFDPEQNTFEVVRL